MPNIRFIEVINKKDTFESGFYNGCTLSGNYVKNIKCGSGTIDVYDSYKQGSFGVIGQLYVMLDGSYSFNIPPDLAYKYFIMRDSVILNNEYSYQLSEKEQQVYRVPAQTKHIGWARFQGTLWDVREESGTSLTSQIINTSWSTTLEYKVGNGVQIVERVSPNNSTKAFEAYIGYDTYLRLNVTQYKINNINYAKPNTKLFPSIIYSTSEYYAEMGASPISFQQLISDSGLGNLVYIKCFLYEPLYVISGNEIKSISYAGQEISKAPEGKDEYKVTISFAEPDNFEFYLEWGNVEETLYEGQKITASHFVNVKPKYKVEYVLDGYLTKTLDPILKQSIVDDDIVTKYVKNNTNIVLKPSGLRDSTGATFTNEFSYKTRELISIDRENWWKYLTISTDYAIGQNIKEVLDKYTENYRNDYVLYTNGTTKKLSELCPTTISYSCSLGEINDNLIVQSGTVTFTITVNISSDGTYFETLSHVFNCVVPENDLTPATSIKLIGNNIFNYGDLLTLERVDAYNNEELYTSVSETSRLINLFEWEPAYQTKLTTLQSEPFNLTCSVARKTDVTTQIQYVVNGETNFNVDYKSIEAQIIYSDEDVFNLDKSLIEVTITEYKFTNVETTEPTVKTLTNDSYKIEPVTLTQAAEKAYPIYISYTNSYNQTFNKTFNLTIGKNIPKSIRVSSGDVDTTIYYSNTVRTFHIPTGLTFELLYKDDVRVEPINNSDLSDTNKYAYYLEKSVDNILRSELKVGETEVPADTQVIYIYSKEYNVFGQYTIQFKEDKLMDIQLANNIEFTLGNMPNTYKDKTKLKISYESGYSKEDTNFYFLEDKYILSETDEIKYVYNGKTYTISKDQITFIKPNIKALTLNLGNFRTAYNNEIDNINLNTLPITVSYENATYTQDLVYTFGDTLSDTTKYIASCPELPNYNFNGSEIINVDMETDTQKVITLTFKVLNRFDTTNETNNTISTKVTVFTMTEIIGITLLQVTNTYTVGDEFLNVNDKTRVRLYYKSDTEGTTKTLEIPLNSAISVINTLPIKGTILNTVGNQTIKVSCATNNNISLEYNINVLPNYAYNENTIHSIVAVKYDGDYVLNSETTLKDPYLLVEEYDEDGIQNTEVIDGIRKLSSNTDFDTVKIYGYLADIGDKNKNGRVVFFEDYISPIEASNNVTVKYPCEVEGNADKINNCTFGILFGNNNSKNRLFVSGNPSIANCDWHSGTVAADVTNMDSNGNFAYFEDTSYCFYGETDNKIVGYDIVSDDRLLVLKSASDKETTIYFRTPTLVKAINGSSTAVTDINNNTLYQEEFALTKGNNSIAGISSKAIVNFNGDTLFISNENTVCGLDLTGITGDNQRYANSRSYYIDQDLKNNVMDDCWLYSDNTNLMLCMPNKFYITNYKLYNSSSRQYEWFVCDIRDIQSIMKYNNILYFGNSRGQIFKVNDIYQDVNKLFLNKGSLGVVSQNENDNKIVLEKSIVEQIDTTKECTLYLNYQDNDYVNRMYYELGIITNDKNTQNFDFLIDNDTNTISLQCTRDGKIDYETIFNVKQNILENEIIYLNHTETESEILGIEGSPTKEYYKGYYLKSVDYEDDDEMEFDKYKLYDANTKEEVDLSNLWLGALCYIANSEMDVINVDKTNATLQLKSKNTDKVLNIVRYANQPVTIQYKGEIRMYTDIEAYYITKPYDFGTLNYYKTVYAWTISNDTDLESNINITYASNKVPLEKQKTIATTIQNVVSTAKNVDFKDLAFTRYDFTSRTTPSTYIKYHTLSNQEFICFAFKNTPKTNSVLCSVEVTYAVTIPVMSNS